MILNKTNGEKIDIKITRADNFLSRFKGLMFKSNIDFGMLIKTKLGSAVHTSFKKFPIDIYFLDENKKIFETTSLNPWKFYKPKKNAAYIFGNKKRKIEFEKRRRPRIYLGFLPDFQKSEYCQCFPACGYFLCQCPSCRL